MWYNIFIAVTMLFTPVVLSAQAGDGHKVTVRSGYDLAAVDSSIRAGWALEVTGAPGFSYPFVTAFRGRQLMFYWDTYFINRGLLVTGNLQLARNNTLNILRVVDSVGYMGNAAGTTWGMNRSQPPYLSIMVRDIFEAAPDTAFLRYAFGVLKKEYHFWTDTSAGATEDHRTAVAGMQRYYHHASPGDLGCPLR